MSNRHNVFVSYYHADDEDYRNEFDRICQDANITVSKSVNIGDIDNGNNTDTVMRIIRDQYLRDATVTAVLIGPNTWKRKYVDWEIAASLRSTRHNSRNGLLGIFLPEHPDYGQSEFNKFIIPPRLADNTGNGYAKVYDWKDDPSLISNWIHRAFQDRHQILPDNSRPRFANNRPVHQQQWQP